MTVGTARLAQLVAPANTNNVVLVKAATGTVVIVKSIAASSDTGAATLSQVFVRPAGPPSTQFFTANLTSTTPYVYAEFWLALAAGDELIMNVGAAATRVWISGTVLHL